LGFKKILGIVTQAIPVAGCLSVILYIMGCKCKTLKISATDKGTIMEEIIRRKLAESLKPSVLEVVNESHLHAGHAGDNGSGQTHFRVKVVSSAFSGMSRVEMQRLVYKILEMEMRIGIHALSINALAE
jgi:BolA protein